MQHAVSGTDPDLNSGPGTGLLAAQPLEFKQKFNLRPFQFRHRFGDSALFGLPRLASVAERMLERGDSSKVVMRSAKNALSEATFKNMPLQQQLVETVRQLGDANVWLKLTSANTVDPEYAEVLQQVLREVEDLADQPVRELISWSGLTVFCASPRATTPYHIDHESNFLFQVQGSKDVSLHNPNERDIVPEDQLESFYAGDFEAAQYRPELQPRGTIFRLDPGTVVHHPPLAPHWVQNGPDISVSVSIGFSLRPLDRIARVYQVNHFLRRLGLHPTPPGRSRLRDELKMAGIGMLSKSNPTTPDEILFSGLTRLTKPPRAVKRWVRSLRHQG